jgi:ssDNA-binding Zn-finger/Zn-ribbon topoisomerase 1
MSFLQLRYFNRDIELSNSERRTIYRGVRKLWWSRRRNFVIYVVSCAVRLTVVNLRIVFSKGWAAALGRGGCAVLALGFLLV